MTTPASLRFEAIFFDMDGLLANSEPISLRATRDVFAPLGIEITDEWYVDESLAKARSVFALLDDLGFSLERIEELRMLRRSRYEELLKTEVQAVDGAEEALKALHGRLLMAVVTSSFKSNFDIIMERTGFKRFFDFSITCDDVRKTKPDPEPYRTALERSKKLQQRCLALEDSQQGVRAAKAAGLTCYAIPDEMTKTHDFSIADKVLGSIREVPALVGI